MTKEQYDSIEQALDKAEESVVPYPVVSEDEVAVVGDANLTEIKKEEFKITFYIPQKREDGTVGYTMTEKVFKDVFVQPRYAAEIEMAATMIRPYFTKLNQDGGLSKLTDEEKLDVLRSFDRDIMDHLYELVSRVLHIDSELKDFMYPTSVVDTTVKILLTYQDMVNASDGFFG